MIQPHIIYSQLEVGNPPMTTTKLVYQCYLCSHLLAGNICFEHHCSECKEPRQPLNYRPLQQHNKNPAFLCKWLDCSKCKLQKVIASAKPGSFTSLRFRVVCWARMIFLLIAKHRVMMSWKITCKYPKLDQATFNLVVDCVL